MEGIELDGVPILRIQIHDRMGALAYDTDNNTPNITGVEIKKLHASYLIEEFDADVVKRELRIFFSRRESLRVNIWRI